MSPVSLKDLDPWPIESNEVVWAKGRFPSRTYLHRPFRLNLPASRDHGQLSRYVVKVFDEPAEFLDDSDWEWSEETIVSTPGGRKQIKLQIAREAGMVRELRLESVPTNPDATKVQTLLRLDRDGAARLLELVNMIPAVTLEGAETVRVDDSLLRDLIADPDAVQNLYRRDPERFRQLIADDQSADDLVALAHRRDVVRRFRELLSDRTTFDAAAAVHGGPENVWQNLLEEESWILGVSLAGQLLTSWDEHKLEQVVTGFSVTGGGKRTDALLQTNGRIRSLVFAEIKTHLTPLLEDREYRPEAWPPSRAMAGGVAQIQRTVEMAASDIGDRLLARDSEGADSGEAAFIVRPRCFLIIGTLAQLRGASGVHVPKYRSFELYRRNLDEPEIITFDELLARAEWHVQAAESRAIS